MSYVIFGRAIKNEHLSLAILSSTFGAAWLATRGGKSSSTTHTGQSVQQARESVPLNASSSEEEDFIKKFIAEAEKEEAHGTKH